jgi:hypothetical protein
MVMIPMNSLGYSPPPFYRIKRVDSAVCKGSNGFPKIVLIPLARLIDAGK